MKYFTGWNTSWSMGLCLTWSITSLCFTGSNPEVLACVLQDEMSYRIKCILKYAFVSYRMKYLLKVHLCVLQNEIYPEVWVCVLQDQIHPECDTGDWQLLHWDVPLLQRPSLWPRGLWTDETLAQNLQIYQQSKVREHKTYKFINKARWGSTKLTNLSTKQGEGAQNLQIYQQSKMREHKTYKFINKARWGSTKLTNL